MTRARPSCPDDATVFLVEDDAALADALQFLLGSRGMRSEHFDSAEAFWSYLTTRQAWPQSPSCIVLDVRMKRMSGIELFDRLRLRDPSQLAPVIFLTGHGDIEMAVEALKKGALDFFEKPFNDNRLADRLLEGLELSRERLQQAMGAADVDARLARLSARERDVMALVLAGKLNKLIAHELGISMRTVEVHRASLFAKMQVRSAVELAHLVGRAPLNR
ncbi:MAG: response regulator transcription factor [Burkholderiaceae bacterium]